MNKFFFKIKGQNNQAGKSILKTDFDEKNTIEKNLKVAIKILLKTMDSSTPSPDRVELSTLRKNKSGEVLHEMLTEEQVFFIFYYYFCIFHI
jgi:20S proteasome subunit alpha 3